MTTSILEENRKRLVMGAISPPLSPHVNAQTLLLAFGHHLEIIGAERSCREAFTTH